jgi:hypothetical protein
MVLAKIDALGANLERRGLSRALVVTTLGGFPILDTVTAALGARCAGVFTGIVQHVPRGAVNALVTVRPLTREECWIVGRVVLVIAARGSYCAISARICANSRMTAGPSVTRITDGKIRKKTGKISLTPTLRARS